MTLGYFDWERKEYRPIPVKEQVEVLSMIGDVAQENGKPKVHVHVVVGRSDGTTRGGHLMEGRVRPTLEVILTESPRASAERKRPGIGIGPDPAVKVVQSQQIMIDNAEVRVREAASGCDHRRLGRKWGEPRPRRLPDGVRTLACWPGVGRDWKGCDREVEKLGGRGLVLPTDVADP